MRNRKLLAACFSAPLILGACLFDGPAWEKTGGINAFALTGDTTIVISVGTFESRTESGGILRERPPRYSLALLTSKTGDVEPLAAQEVPVEAGPFIPEAFFACKDGNLIALRSQGHSLTMPGCEQGSPFQNVFFVTPDGKRLVFFDDKSDTLYVFDDTLGRVGSRAWTETYPPYVLSLNAETGKLFVSRTLAFENENMIWSRLSLPSMVTEIEDTLPALVLNVRGLGHELVCAPGTGKPREVCWEPDAALFSQFKKNYYKEWDPARNSLMTWTLPPAPGFPEATFIFHDPNGDSTAFAREEGFAAYVRRH